MAQRPVAHARVNGDHAHVALEKTGINKNAKGTKEGISTSNMATANKIILMFSCESFFKSDFKLLFRTEKTVGVETELNSGFSQKLSPWN